jgi:hypothetical protein
LRTLARDLGRLTALVDLYACVWVEDVTQMLRRELNFNKLTGTVPSELALLTALNHLYV